MPNNNNKNGISAKSISDLAKRVMSNGKVMPKSERSRSGGFTFGKEISGGFEVISALLSPFMSRLAATLAACGLTAFKAIAKEGESPLAGENVFDVLIASGYVRPADLSVKPFKSLADSPRYAALLKAHTLSGNKTLSGMKAYAEKNNSGRRFTFTEYAPESKAEISALVHAGYIGFADCKPGEARIIASEIRAYVPDVSTDSKHAAPAKENKGKGKSKVKEAPAPAKENKGKVKTAPVSNKKA